MTEPSEVEKLKAEKSLFVNAILEHSHSFRLSGDRKFTICNWCDERTSNALPINVVYAKHMPNCVYLLALNESNEEQRLKEQEYHDRTK